MTHLYEENPTDLGSYSRREAIDDGILIDLSELEICAEFYPYPLACTPAVWLIVEHGAKDSLCLNDLESIVSDILRAAKQSRDDSGHQGFSDTSTDFTVHICDRGTLVPHPMRLIFGHDDYGDACMTLLFLNECST